MKLGYVGGPGAGLGLFVNFNIKKKIFKCYEKNMYLRNGHLKDFQSSGWLQSLERQLYQLQLLVHV